MSAAVNSTVYSTIRDLVNVIIIVKRFSIHIVIVFPTSLIGQLVNMPITFVSLIIHIHDVLLADCSTCTYYI